MDPKLSLSWDSHQKSICNGLSLLQQRGEFVDMTIAADGHFVKVHQMVMSLVSPFIKNLITSVQCPHPVLFLNRVSYETLQSILEYAYTGEVLVPRESLYSFLEACKVLHIKGLEDESIKETADGAMLLMTGYIDENTVQPPVLGQPKEQTTVTKSRNDDAVDSEMDKCDTHDEVNDLDDSQMSDDATEAKEAAKKQIEYQKIYARVKQKQDSTGSTVQYSLSCQGSIQVILNRYLYRLRHARKNNEKMWRCADYNKKRCQAYVITKGDIVIERGCAHSHPFHDRQILKRLQNGNIYEQFNAAKNVALLTKNSALADIASADNQHSSK